MATMTAAEALALPMERLASARPIDDRGIYDHRHAWAAMRAAAEDGDLDDLRDMGGVVVTVGPPDDRWEFIVTR